MMSERLRLESPAIPSQEVIANSYERLSGLLDKGGQDDRVSRVRKTPMLGKIIGFWSDLTSLDGPPGRRGEGQVTQDDLWGVPVRVHRPFDDRDKLWVVVGDPSSSAGKTTFCFRRGGPLVVWGPGRGRRREPTMGEIAFLDRIDSLTPPGSQQPTS